MAGEDAACQKRVCQAGGRESKPPAAPPPVFAEIDPISGRENGKERIVSLENGIFRRKNPLAPAVHAAGCVFSLRGLRPAQTLPEFFDSLGPRPHGG